MMQKYLPIVFVFGGLAGLGWLGHHGNGLQVGVRPIDSTQTPAPVEPPEGLTDEERGHLEKVRKDNAAQSSKIEHLTTEIDGLLERNDELGKTLESLTEELKKKQDRELYLKHRHPQYETRPAPSPEPIRRFNPAVSWAR